MINAISNFFGAIGEFCGLLRKKAELDNAPEMQAAAAGKTDQQLSDEAVQAIRTRDLAQLRKNLAE